MGIKTVGNDLDNAWIAFDNVTLPRSALLSRYAEVSADGVYNLTTTGIKPFEMIGQRLYTGRVAVAQAALSYRRKLFEDTRAYADAKLIPSFVPGASPSLSSIPQLQSLFAEAEETAARLEAYVGECEERLTPLLRTGEVPSEQLAHMIATAKVPRRRAAFGAPRLPHDCRLHAHSCTPSAPPHCGLIAAPSQATLQVKAVEHSIDLCWRLKQEVGSYALMGDSGFGTMDFLQCAPSL